MKKTLIALIVSLGLAASAQAIVTGFEAGYLLDSEEEYVALRAGYELRASQIRSHQLELELGYTDASESGVKGRIMPLTVNYRLEQAGQGKWGFFGGAGAGLARTRVKVSGFGFDRAKNSLAVQAFAGVSWQAGPSTKLTLGAKYIWIDDVDFGFGDIKVGDDVAISAGITFRF